MPTEKLAKAIIFDMKGFAHHYVLLAVIAACAVCPGCDNELMHSVWKDYYFVFSEPELYGSFDFDASRDENWIETITVYQEIKCRERTSIPYRELLVATDPDMQSIVAKSSASISLSSNGTKIVTGKVSVPYVDDGAYYIQVVIGSAEEGQKIFSTPFCYDLMFRRSAPTLSARVSKRGWSHVDVALEEHDDKGWAMKKTGILFSCNPEELTLESATHKIEVDGVFDECNVALQDATRTAGVDEDGASYYLRAFAVNECGMEYVGYDNVMSLKTIPYPKFSSVSFSDVKQTSVKLEYEVLQNPEDETMLSYHVKYGRDKNRDNTMTADGKVIKGLDPDTQYYCWPYITKMTTKCYT